MRWISCFVSVFVLLCFPLPRANGDDAGLTTLWQIGQANRNDTEFALAPSHYDQFAEDGFYAVGRSDSHQSWPYVQPGPADGWAGSRRHTFQIVFGLKAIPASACRLELSLLDTQAVTPPCVQVTINNITVERQLPPGMGDAAVMGQPAQGKPFLWSIPVPASALRMGINKIAITTLSGSWLLYDSVRFLASPATETDTVSPIWFSTVQPQPFLIRGTKTGQDALRHVVTAHIWNFGPTVKTDLDLNGEKTPVTLASGANTATLSTPEVHGDAIGTLTAEVGSATVAINYFKIPFVRHWTVYLLPHSHVDIGYTEPQERVRKQQIANLHEALDLIQKSKDYPADAQFKWNLEVLWPMDSYLRTATPAQRQEFFDALRSGKLVLNAYYGNLLTGLCSADELLHAFDPALQVARTAGVPLDSAMQDDVPGYTWGNVTALSQAGVKYWSLGPNNFDRMGSTLIQWHDKPFYWASPSGKSRVLCWMVDGGYALGNSVGNQIIPFLPGYLDGLDQTGYPYDIACLQWCVNGDNGRPDANLAVTVRDWNATHAYPHLVIAGTREPFVALAQRYGSRIPTYRGDFTPYWEDGAGSTARETALNRNAIDHLAQAETLWAMKYHASFPAARFHDAWDNALLYSEHTWGAYDSIDDPDSDFVKTEWAYKQAFAVRADAESQSLIAPPHAISGKIDVFNTQSWTRTDLVLVPITLSRAGDRVQDTAGHLVPSQRLHSGQLAILVRDLPPLSARRYAILPGKAAKMGTASADGNVLTNGLLTVKMNPKTGAIADLHSVSVPGNLVDTHSGTAVNDYFYLPGGDLKDLVQNGPATITVEDAGPLVAALRIESQAPGCRSLTRRVRLITGINRVDLADTVDKLAIREKEGVHIGFGFRIPHPVMHMEMPLSIIRPELDQLPAANKNWYPVQHWVDVSNRKYGVTWATVDAPLVEVGAITANMPSIVPQDDPRWLPHIKSSGTFYSWVMNNHWHTNYKADQSGPVTFRYSVAPHGVYTPDAATRFGQGISQPLLALPASGHLPTGSLLQISSPGVTVTELKPSDDGTAWIVRLWGASGHSERVRLTWQGQPLAHVYLSNTQEQIGSALGPIFTVPGNGLITLRIPHK